MDRSHKRNRKKLDGYFTPSRKQEGSFNYDFHDYHLEVSFYKTCKGCWSYSRGIVSKNGREIADIKRNYSSFWHTWVDHPNGKKYLLCGEDYQGYSVVNLTDETYQAYLPEAAHKGYGFCWTEAKAPPSGKLLAVAGCYWACPYEIVIYDFSTPDILPYKEIARIDLNGEFKGWQDEDNLIVVEEIDTRKSDGKRWSELTKEESAEAIDKEDCDSFEETIIIPWRGSTPDGIKKGN